jgi:hypothetical protein
MSRIEGLCAFQARVISTPIRAPERERPCRTVGRHGASGVPGLDTRSGATTPRTGLSPVRRLLQRAPAPPSDGTRSSGRSGRPATPGGTTPECDLETPDPGRTHQRVPSNGVMIEFFGPHGFPQPALTSVGHLCVHPTDRPLPSRKLVTASMLTTSSIHGSTALGYRLLREGRPRLARCTARRHSGEQHVRRRKSAELSGLPLAKTLRTSGLPHPGRAQTGPS